MTYKKFNSWNPLTSKWKAALKKGVDISIKKSDNILYLGASSGTTVGQISKLTDEIIFAVENSPEMAKDLVKLAKKKNNVAPIFSDARDMDYIKKNLFDEKINILFQDIPSRDQYEILLNASKLVDKDCLILFSLKTQSISQKNPTETYKEISEKLKREFRILKSISLEPFHKKHYFFVLKKL